MINKLSRVTGLNILDAGCAQSCLEVDVWGCRSWKDLGKETGKDFPLVANETTRRVGGMQISHSHTILRGGLMNWSKVEAVPLDGGCRTLQLKAVHP